MANKKNTKKNSKKKNAPVVKEIEEQKIQNQAAEPEVVETEAIEVIEEKAAEVVEDKAAEVIEEKAAEAAEVTKDTVVLEPAEIIEEAAEVTEEAEPVEEAAPGEVSDEATKDAEPVASEPKEVTDFTLVMDPVAPENDAQTAAPKDDSNFADASQEQISPEEEKLAAEYAAARAEGPAASTAITPIVPVTGYGDDSKTVEFDAPKAAKEPKESKLKGFFDKPVSRKFLAGALGLALVLNGLIAAGIMALFANDLEDDISAVKKSVKELEENSGNMGGGPGMGMTPPDWNSDNGNGNGFYGRDDSDSGDYWDDDWDDDDWGSSAPGNQQNGDQNSQQIQQNSGNVSIGIVIRDNNGVYISQVTGSNAKKAGFQEGDKIIEFDGDDIDDSNELIEEVQEHKAGDKVTVVIERNGKQQKITTTLE
ncbi:MAG: PDZ domain-containing protein [Mogibacterium sp.]|nr:PDZ domain-containing protein [Mogibacterium sp.]